METNAYTSAMERLAVTPVLRERVLEGALAQAETTPVRGRQQFRRVLPLALAACLLLVVAVSVFPMLLNREHNVTLGNPMHKSESIAQLKENVSFPLSAPGILPEGYTVESTAVIAGILAQIEYAGPDGTITYRMAQGGDDVSGDYNQHAETVSTQIGTQSVTMKGTEGKVSLCVWKDDICSYALSFTQTVTPETARAIIESVHPVE